MSESIWPNELVIHETTRLSGQAEKSGRPDEQSGPETSNALYESPPKTEKLVLWPQSLILPGHSTKPVVSRGS